MFHQFHFLVYASSLRGPGVGLALAWLCSAVGVRIEASRGLRSSIGPRLLTRHRSSSWHRPRSRLLTRVAREVVGSALGVGASPRLLRLGLGISIITIGRP